MGASITVISYLQSSLFTTFIEQWRIFLSLSFVSAFVSVT